MQNIGRTIWIDLEVPYLRNNQTHEQEKVSKSTCLSAWMIQLQSVAVQAQIEYHEELADLV